MGPPPTKPEKPKATKPTPRFEAVGMRRAQSEKAVSARNMVPPTVATQRAKSLERSPLRIVDDTPPHPRRQSTSPLSTDSRDTGVVERVVSKVEAQPTAKHWKVGLWWHKLEGTALTPWLSQQFRFLEDYVAQHVRPNIEGKIGSLPPDVIPIRVGPNMFVNCNDCQVWCPLWMFFPGDHSRARC